MAISLVLVLALGCSPPGRPCAQVCSLRSHLGKAGSRVVGKGRCKILDGLRDTSPPVGYFRRAALCRMTFSYDCFELFLVCMATMRARPSQEPAAGCFHAREPESLRAARTQARDPARLPEQAQRCRRSTRTASVCCIVHTGLPHVTGQCHWQQYLIWPGVVFGLGLGPRRQAKRSVRRPEGLEVGSPVCLVAAANKTTGSSLTTVSPAVAHIPHTDERPDSQRCRPSRPTGLGNAGQSPSTLWMDRVGLRFVEKCAWSDIADGWTRRCRVTARRSACSSACCPELEGHPMPSYPMAIHLDCSVAILPQPPLAWPRVCSSTRQFAAGCDDGRMVFLGFLVKPLHCILCITAQRLRIRTMNYNIAAQCRVELDQVERPFLEVALAGLEPKRIMAKSGDVPDGNETISSHLGLVPERLGDSRWAAFPRRASHGIGEFGQAKKGGVGWGGAEWAGIDHMYCLR